MNNLRFLILLTILILITGNTSAQPVVEWTARLNGLLDSTDVASDLTVDAAGNTYVTGYSNSLLGLLTGAVTVSYDPDGNTRWRSEYDQLLNDAGSVIAMDNTGQYVYVAGYTNALLNLTAADYLIIKYRASDGQQMWARTYGFGLLGDDKAAALIIDSQNNPVITGYSQGFLLLLTPYDYATVKYDQNGNQLWAQRYNGTGNNNDKAFGIAEDSDDNIIVTGESVGTSSGYDYATVKYGPDGSPQWVSRYNGTANDQDRSYAIVVDNTDNIIVTGESSGSSSGADYVTVKYNPSGSQQWASRYNGPGNNEDRSYAIVVDNTDNVIVTGSSRSAGTPGSEDYATLKYNPSGSQMWVSRYNGPGNNEDRAYAIIVDNTDNIFVTGSSRSGSSSGTEDYATVMYSPAGSELWDVRYDGTGSNEDRAYAIVVDNSDNIYITGSSRNGSVLGSEDYLTLKYSREDLVHIPPYTGIVPSEFNLYQNYPNPFNPSTVIEFDLPEDGFVTLKIFNSRGIAEETIIQSVKKAGKYSILWKAEKYPSGIYFCRLEVSGISSGMIAFSQTKKLIFIK